MESKSKFFIAVYTNEVKDYAAEAFFKPLASLTVGGVVDNSTDKQYHQRLMKLTSLPVYHLEIPYEPKHTLFQRNVAESAQFLRQKFLESTCDYFLILESDVIVTPDILERLSNTIKRLPEDWGAVGCLYYEGFHDYGKAGLQRTTHVLSGATVYRREAVEKFDFRWSSDNLGAFPDAWWSIDAGKDYSLWNDHAIRFKHLHNTDGTRYSKQL
jgi:hypothetical protein